MDPYRIWAVRAGRSNQADHIFLNRSMLAIGVSETGRDASELAPNRLAFKQALGLAESELSPGSIPIRAGQLFRFVHQMNKGDRVIYPRKVDRTLRWGEVTGDYVYDGGDAADFPHRRAVRWIGSISRDAFSQGALYELGSVLTLFEVKTFAEEFVQKFEQSLRPPETVDPADEDEASQSIARDVSETTRDFISKTIKTDFKGRAMEPLVADLFRAMGYKAHVTRAVKDDGVDVIAHRDELGIEPPRFKIQVKTQDANVGADAVKAFYAGIHDRDVGIFIATGGYTSAALEFARTRGNLRMIDGIELIDLIEKYYDQFDLKHRQRIPLRRILVPDPMLREDE